MSTKLDIKQDLDLQDDETGKFYLFWNKYDTDNQMYGFSSIFDNIGVLEKHDCWLKNKTKVLVLSEPTEANHPKIGMILVSKIMANKIMWVGTNSLLLIDE